ncbi:MAG: signal peptidase, partial [Pseudonocardiales bacterium]|nr:signal peptidase [Pseudonocardiales bacterium]
MTDENGPAGPNPADAVPPSESPAAAPSNAAPPSFIKPAPGAAEAAPPGSPPAAPAGSSAESPQAAAARRKGAHRSDSAWAQLGARRAERKRAKAVAPHKPHRKAPWWELPALVALAILIAILVKTFVIQPFYIPSESMEKTLHGCTG